MTEAQRVYRELKQDIVTCKLAPGLSISELEMCTRYSASRTPVREACRRLTEEFLMQMVPFRGYSITPLTIEEFRHLHELQTVVEPAIAGLAAERATPEQLKEIEGWATYEYKVGQKNSYYTFLEWNRNFHISIAAASRNRPLLEIVTNTQTRLMRYYYLVIVMDSYGPQLVSEHQELVRALRAGNAALARERAGEHLEATVKRTMRVNLPSVSATTSTENADVEEWLWKTPPSVRKIAKHPRRKAAKPVGLSQKK
jgi:DNA-binding GntR family transcriptional regulator